MTDPTPTPDAADDDDAVADAFAAELEARALRDPAFCRMLVRVVKGEKRPAEMTQEELAAKWGTDRYTLNREVLKAIKKLRLYPEIQALKPQS